MFTRNSIHWAELCALVLTVILLAAPGVAQAQSTPVRTLDEEERVLLRIINDYRRERGLQPLRVSLTLTRAADWMSKDMATKNYLNHTDSLGRRADVRMAAAGYTYQCARGEVLGINNGSAEKILQSWKQSAAHHQILISGDYKTVGLRRSCNEAQRCYWAADFGSYVDQTLEVPTQSVASVTVLSAENFSQTVVPGGIVAAFGTQLSTRLATATSQEWPTVLAETSVLINGTPARLLFVAEKQINFAVPSKIASGEAFVDVLQGNKVIASGKVMIDSVSAQN
jgi:uncharacterized protein YkwD